MLLPALASLTFLSKKGLDFADWAAGGAAPRARRRPRPHRYLSGTNKLVPEPFPVLVIHPDGSSTTYASLSQCALDLGASRHPVKKIPRYRNSL